ncbi:hypothetical protein H0E87_028233 [Populus deltoides]|uniref:HMG box domain-containing protein n=1 Tax=Populus deltoides TaxID=3696 RepID=A0A8T2WS55_POPDE|nr:hypothetical protein H0E87_028233 [Populus deltoides]
MQRNLSMVMLQDEDFVAGKDDGGSPTDDSGDGESDASESGDEKEASHSIHSTNPTKKDFKREASSSKATTKRKSRDGEESQKKRKPKKKKDPNAPKRSKSAYMFFSQMERENVRKSNPGIVFGEIAKALADKWNAMSAEEKEPYEEMARNDKKRYKLQVNDYKNPQPMMVDSENESDS